MKYTVVSSNYQEPFIDLINKKLSEGWSLYGDIFMNEKTFNQPMVMYEDIWGEDVVELKGDNSKHTEF